MVFSSTICDNVTSNSTKITTHYLVLFVKDGASIDIFLPDNTFILYYLHSVEKTPCWEYFKVNDSIMILEKTKYSQYGAGLPSLESDGQFILKNNFFEVYGLNRSFTAINLLCHPLAQHKLYTANNMYDLSLLFGKKLLTITAFSK